MWSDYQVNVFKYNKESKKHGVVDAVAGSGKSTTGVQCVKDVYDGLSDIQFLAFNTHIKVDINEKLAKSNLPPLASTYNGFGNGVVRRYLPKAKFNQYKTITIAKQILPKNKYALVSCCIRIVSLCKNLLLSPTHETINFISSEYDVSPPRGMEEDFNKYILTIVNKCLDDRTMIDFDDQKYLIVKMGMKLPKLDYLYVDEFQDSCPVELAIVNTLIEEGARCTVFGDPYQAIYSFKGTASNSMENFATKLSAERLPLSICYRCPQAVVKEAQLIVPHIEAAPLAKEGFVDSIKMSEFVDKASENDLVLCRVKADLIRSVLHFLSIGRRAYILGDDVTDALKYLVERTKCEDHTGISEFLTLVKELTDNTVKNNEDKPERADMALDLQAAIELLAEDCSNVTQLKGKIDSLTKANNGICHMSIHKSKGLESIDGGNVYILRPDKLPLKRSKNQDEEMRLKYVAITRVKGGGGLVYVQN